MIRIDRVDTDAILEHYGFQNQKFKAAEELSELQMVLLQDANESGKVDVQQIHEEMADVYIMLEQLKSIYGICDDEVEDIVVGKLARTYLRMGREINGDSDER